MFLFIRYYVVEVCALPSALLVFFMKLSLSAVDCDCFLMQLVPSELSSLGSNPDPAIMPMFRKQGDA